MGKGPPYTQSMKYLFSILLAFFLWPSAVTAVTSQLWTEKKRLASLMALVIGFIGWPFMALLGGIGMANQLDQ